MKLKAEISAFLLILFCSSSYAQMNQYNYKRELQGIKATWHKVVLPEEIFGKVVHNLADIRIFGITSAKDTIEASYLLKLKDEKIVVKDVNFRFLNTTQNENGYYFTLEVPSEEAINQLKLDFNKQNFDWKVTLEGSQNQQEWFTVVDDYRILSIKNDETDYQFTKIIFPNAKFHFFRLLIKSEENPELVNVKATYNEISDGGFMDYAIANIKTIREKQAQRTVLEIDLKSTVAVSSIQIKVKDTFDYYRPINIQYVADSVKTEQGWNYLYENLTTGTLNSIENNEFKFESTILKKLKISILNQDNEPLNIETLAIKGYVHELLVRFTEPATYFLTYGNKKATKPNYDIERFVTKVPDTLTVLMVGNEQKIDKKDTTKAPLFKNKMWLWGLMGIIILVLGWFSVKMIGKKR
ncbi:MAG: DUF3999 family protein [Lutibacter sp.]|nr:DUF3999 family protein [Lutibacter sp.]MDT8416262.1 DUF3999 family protein [Lutibacter sp.]